MALFHLSVTQTKRSAGQSAIASAAYRKAGYSPKFRSEHEADILLHQAAKRSCQDFFAL